MEDKTRGLTVKQAFLIMLVIILIMAFFNVVLDFKDKDFGRLIRYIISVGTSIIVAIKIYEKCTEKYNLDISRKHMKIIPLMMLLPIFLQYGLTSHFVYLIPMPESVKQSFYESANSYSWQTLLTFIVLAPILEEIICRGIILKGLLKNYNPIAAIVVSSLIFGLLHLNPWQFIGSFGIGIINGWIFWKTKNILLPIAVHFANNLFFTIFSLYFGASYLADKRMQEVVGSFSNQLFSVFASLILLSLILFYLNKKFQQEKLSTTANILKNHPIINYDRTKKGWKRKNT